MNGLNEQQMLDTKLMLLQTSRVRHTMYRD